LAQFFEVNLSVRSGGLQRLVAQKIGDEFQSRSLPMSQCSPTAAQYMRSGSLNAAAGEGPPNGVSYPVGRQGPAPWSQKADKELSVRNCWASSLQIYRQSSGNTGWQGQESFSPLFGRAKSQGRGPPIYILQRQISHLVGPQRQFREAQCHGVIASADRRGAIKAAQKLMSRILVQNYQRWLGGRACR
jgi:hypothetical protein